MLNQTCIFYQYFFGFPHRLISPFSLIGENKNKMIDLSWKDNDI